MLKAATSAVRMLIVLGAALICAAIDVSVAHAQSASCSRLEATLATLDRNNNFRGAEGNRRELRALERDLQRVESRYVRDGCNDDAKAGRRLSNQCRALAREITQGRENLASLSRSVETGDAVEQQREAILQEIARFGCNSRVRVLDDDDARQASRGNIFERLFGNSDENFDGEGGFREEEWDPWGNYHTVRTLCVRKSDGFYWPISYSTLTDYVANDAEQCRAMCPGLDVDLYYYDNPGQEPEQMINMWGEPYAALPTAFKFRTEFDRSARCQQAADYGSINITQAAGGQSRAVITFNGATFPLPLRDPRRQVEIVQATLDTSHFVNVPLPRRRPPAPGEEVKPVPPTAAPVAEDQTRRIVTVGDKRVRIVGPMTPYAQVVAEGT